MLEGTGEVLVKDGNNGRGEGGGDGGGRAPEGGEAGDGLPSIPAPAKAPREGAMYQVEEREISPVCPWATLAPADVAAVAKAGLVWSPEDVDQGQARALASALAALRDRDGRLEANDRQGDGVGKGKAKAEESGLRGEAMEVGWMVLRATGNVFRAVETAVDASRRMAWSQEEEAVFVEGMNEYDKNFVQIKALLPKRSVQDVVAHFYEWKQRADYRAWKADRPLQYLEHAIPDYHADVCDMCERPGDLLCCDTCNLAFHMKCLGFRDEDVPEDFSCSQCQAQYLTTSERERAKRWVESKVRKVQTLREKEMQRLSGAPAGYIGRRRTKASQSERGQKRKREDCTTQTFPSAAGTSPSASVLPPSSATALPAAAIPLLPPSACLLSSSPQPPRSLC
ncbi:hypothetical protein NSK_006718 [Nannochloropsis salina CCMP1776]|uniref:PHD-type domain-containing protein n=1 Tax=Nannochloropsis salina CCMP1776 TaxID=1027361 RepID=A0A4D9CS67_9STRA|nr:hypothetical protein NSK_006718 [Nannochloropsis salina CCMP1776]|eukprot:TFJ82052.1 hypothetical protein NSK_006718 [Nannochloropsis salina CCMP1776]